MFKKFLSKSAPVYVICGIFAAYMSSAWSEEYYRWRDANGGIHYGSTPPQGVEAEKVKVYMGKSTSASIPETASASDENNAAPESPEDAAKRRELQAAQQEECKSERKRLASLKANKPIRMKQDDGSTKYLTKEEIAKEVEKSNQYLKDVCK